MKTKLALIIFIIIALPILFIPISSLFGQDETPSVTVNDQEIGEDYMVTIAEIVTPNQGWMVIHADQDGAPGPVIGNAMVESGTNTDVMVEVDPTMVTDTLYAMLHEDTNNMGEYEFPEYDPPVTDADGNIVVQGFTVTMAEGEMAEEMPATGFNFTFSLIISSILLAPGLSGIFYIRRLRKQ